MEEIDLSLPKTPIPKEHFISSGSTLINLACSGTPYGAYTIGRYFWIFGESSSGKSFLMMTALAEFSINPLFDDYDIIFDNAEDGVLMDIEQYFGPKLAKRVQPPRLDEDGTPIYSSKIEDFYFNLDDRFAAIRKGKGKKFIYLLDSMDALSSKYEGEKFDEAKKADRKGTTAKGDYGDGKAKINSRYMRRVAAELRDTDCILIIISQARDNIDAGMFEEQETHAGGRALKFYAGWQMLSAIGSKLWKEINGTNRQIGINCKLKIKKNRLTGKEWSVQVPIYWSYGFDDIGSCVDFLIDEKHWKTEGNKVVASELDLKEFRSNLPKKIEELGLEVELRSVVTEVWKNIEAQCVVQRKPRYS